VKRREVFEEDFALLVRNMHSVLAAQHQFTAWWFHRRLMFFLTLQR
jgi:hypothetical protein